MLSSLKGKRMMIIGGIAVVALAVVSLMLMQRESSSPPPVAQHAGPPPAILGSQPAMPVSAIDGDESTPDDTAPEMPGVGQPEELFTRHKYTYRSLGRVDPFKSLVMSPLSSSRYFGDQINPEMIRLVGVLEKNGERRALVEDSRGYGYVLKKGDRVLRGRVLEIGGDFVKIRHSLYGVTETMELMLHRKSQGGFPDEQIR